MIKKIRKNIFSELSKRKIQLKFSNEFNNKLKKIKDNNIKIKLYKQILKVLIHPEVGKFLKYSRKGEQELYLDPFRLYYKFYQNEKKIRFIEFSHKDNQ